MLCLLRICFFSLPLFLLLLSPGCKNSSGEDIQEMAQQIGDSMASIDESGGSTGGLRLLDSDDENWVKPIFQRYGESLGAERAACSLASTFGSCTNNILIRTFSNCTVGSATFVGTVTLTFTDGAINNVCAMSAAGHSIARNPSFTITGRRGSTLTVTKTGTNGQLLTKGAGSTFTFSNDGIRRYFTDTTETVTYDYTTQTTSDITITGTSRSGRTMDGGSLRVTDNLSGTYCDFVPSSVTWSSTCNCPISGSWAGSCSDGKTTSLQITGCGTASFALGTVSDTLTFDRCYSL